MMPTLHVPFISILQWSTLSFLISPTFKVGPKSKVCRTPALMHLCLPLVTLKGFYAKCKTWDWKLTQCDPLSYGTKYMDPLLRDCLVLLTCAFFFETPFSGCLAEDSFCGPFGGHIIIWGSRLWVQTIQVWSQLAAAKWVVSPLHSLFLICTIGNSNGASSLGSNESQVRGSGKALI